jgi:hypothetical protein
MSLVAPHATGETPPSAGEIAAIASALRAARPALAARPRAGVLDALAAVVDAWLAPASPWLERAVATLPAATGFSPAMIRHALPTMLEPLRQPALHDLVERQAGARRGPPLILHVLPGNLPGLAAIPAALSLAVGSAALLKPGRGDRAFPALFIESIAARDAALADCLAAAYWPGDDRASGDAALGAADLVVAAGDDTTIADLARRTRGRFIGHGHRLSFAVVSRTLAADQATAAALAADVAIWDQRGCLSPQLCFVEGDRDAAVAFADHLAAALFSLATDLPPAHLALGDRLAIRRVRDAAEWATFDGERAVVHAAADEAAGTVIVEPRAALSASPLGRTIRVMPIASFAALEALLAPHRAILEGVGLAAPEEHWPLLAARLDACGAHLVSRPGAMQRPPLDWRQGGRPRLADWLDDAG